MKHPTIVERDSIVKYKGIDNEASHSNRDTRVYRQLRRLDIQSVLDGGVSKEARNSVYGPG